MVYKKTQSTKLISEFSKVAKYKINIQKSITFIYNYIYKNIFLYTSDEHMDTEIKYTISFTITQKMKILRCKYNKTHIGFVC